MRLFLDTANLADIEKAAALGVIHGVTTNPSLISREGIGLREAITAITKMVDGPIFAEVISADHEGMIREGKELSAIHPNVVIKIPMTAEGMMAVKALSSVGIRTNVTLVFSAAQALLAANAGAAYVSPFIGRVDDVGYDGITALSDIAAVLADGNFPTEIIAASVRSPLHVVQAAEAGADIATVPPKVLDMMFRHPLTDAGLEKFMKDWAVSGKE